MTGDGPQPGVVFDMDGVLVDSWQAHLTSWQELAEEEGRTFGEEDFATTFGKTSREIMWEVWGVEAPSELRRLDDRKEALYRQIVAETRPMMPGAVELVDLLADAGFRLAVGSSGPPENVFLVLDLLDRRSRFDAVVTGHDVERGKPDPEVFLRAARQLGSGPGSTVVVEDAPVGIEAARRAGMAAVALVSTGRHRDDFRRVGPDLVVESLGELGPSILRNLLAERAREKKNGRGVDAE